MSGQRLPAILATLLLHANRTVTVRQLSRGAWPVPPRAVGSNVRTYITQLRAAFAAAGETGPRVVTEPAGYELVIRPSELDLTRFDDLVAEANRALDRSDSEAALELLGRALALWRGDPLDGMSVGPLLQAELARLDKRRLIVTERWADAASVSSPGTAPASCGSTCSTATTPSC